MQQFVLQYDPGEVKRIDHNHTVKEDNIIMDKTVQVGLRIWGEFIEEISNRSTYNVIYLKIQKFIGLKYVTTIPTSAHSTVQEIDVSIKEVSLNNDSVIFVK